MKCRSWAKAIKRWGDDWSIHRCSLERGHKGLHVCKGNYKHGTYSGCYYQATWKSPKRKPRPRFKDKL